MTQRKERMPVWLHSAFVDKELKMAMAATGTFATGGRFGGARIDDNIAERVTQALWTNPFVDPSNIVVTVDASRVVLNGTVDAEQDLDIITAILEDLYCCDEVVIDLGIGLDLDVELSAAA